MTFVQVHNTPTMWVKFGPGWTHVLHMIRGQVPAFNSTFDLDIGLRSIHKRTAS